MGWIAYFDGEADSPPANSKVMHFDDLLASARSRDTRGFLAQPVELTEEEEILLMKLKSLRHWTEHPRPRLHFIDPLWILEAMQAALRVQRECFQATAYRLEEDQEQAANRAFEAMSVGIEVEIEKCRAAGAET